MRISRRAGEKFEKLQKEIYALMSECESKSLRFAEVCEANGASGGVERLKQDIKSLNRIKASLLKYLKEIRRLTARYR